MSNTFVFDENVVVEATTQRSVTGRRDLTSARLVNRVVHGTHRIAWSVSVYARWSSKVERLVTTRQAVSPTFMALFAQVQFDANKCVLPPEGDPPPLPDEHGWSTKLLDDRDFIRLSALFSGVLTTVDGPLLRDIASYGLDSRYKFLAMVPGAALSYAV